MQIVYGYCREDEAGSLLDRFVEQGDFVSFKELGSVGREYMAFAALLPLNVHFVNVVDITFSDLGLWKYTAPPL